MCVRVYFVLCWSLSSLHSTSWRVLMCLGRSWDQILFGKFCFVSAFVRPKAWGLCANNRNQLLENVAFWLAALNVIGVYAQENLGSSFIMDFKTGLWNTALTKDSRDKSVVSWSAMSGSAAQKLFFMVWGSLQQVLHEFLLWDKTPPSLSSFAEVSVLFWITLSFILCCSLASLMAGNSITVAVVSSGPGHKK